MALIQESETRFKTSFSVIQRFLKAINDFQRLASLKNTYSATFGLSKHVTNSAMTINERYPFPEAITEAFAPVFHVQTKQESIKSSCMHLVPLMLVHLKHQLQNKASGLVNIQTMTMPNIHTYRLCGVLLELVSEIELHDIYISATMLHPSLTHLNFITNITGLEAFKQRAAVQIRKLMGKLQGGEQQNLSRKSVLLPQSLLLRA